VIEGVRWVQLALGSEHSILLASSGQVYACGSNRVKQLGRPRFRADTGEGLESSCLAAKTPEGCPTEYHLRSSRPVLVLGSDQSLERVVKVVSGSFHLLALTADGNVFAWGDNRMNQLGQGPGVNRGSGCCATKVPMYIDNAAADEEYAHEWAWAGYKVLDIEAGAHFSIALVMNITGLGCTADGQQTNNKCVKVNPDNGLMEQDWDVPRNIDIIANHFRKDAFDFAKSTTCNCNAKLHLPGGLANCKDNTFAALYPLGDGRCYEPNMNVTVPCRYSFKGKCSNGASCVGPVDCEGLPGTCDRVLRTCSARCPCADRSCPAYWHDDTYPGESSSIDQNDSPFVKAIKKQHSCGCTPSYDTEACKTFLDLHVDGELPGCCLNSNPEAPVPFERFEKKEWEAFNLKFRYPVNRYGTCPQGVTCRRASSAACGDENCPFPDYESIVAAGRTTPDDDHPQPIGNKQTCVCYMANVCVGGTNPGAECNLATESIKCAGFPPGRCSIGGGAVPVAGGSAPVFYGDCVCRNATLLEWTKERHDNAALLNETERAVVYNVTALPAVSLKITFWNSNPCPYSLTRQWSGSDCRLVKPPFQRYIFGWGDTRAGQLARNLLGATSDSKLTAPDDQPPNVARPTSLESLAGLDLLAISAGDFHAGAITASQPFDPLVCNLTHIYAESNGVSSREGGLGPASVIGQPFRCDGRQVYTWGGNTNGELGLGFVTTTTALECIAPGNIKMACESVGGALEAARIMKMSGRNASFITMGYKHSGVRLGVCPTTSRDRCGICFGDNRVCVGCSGITNKKVALDWCGACDGDNSTCTGCQHKYKCDAPGDTDKCVDRLGERVACSPVEDYAPCHQGRNRGTPCCLDAVGLPATPDLSDPSKQLQGDSPGVGPVPCSHFGTTSWRDLPRAGNNFCGLTYDLCDVCDGDHTRCLDCSGVANGKQALDVCDKCRGLATDCVGCDGLPEPDPDQRSVFDACELCNGTNSSCSFVLLVFNGKAGPRTIPPPPLHGMLLLATLLSLSLLARVDVFFSIAD